MSSDSLMAQQCFGTKSSRSFRVMMWKRMWSLWICPSLAQSQGRISKPYFAAAAIWTALLLPASKLQNVVFSMTYRPWQHTEVEPQEGSHFTTLTVRSSYLAYHGGRQSSGSSSRGVQFGVCSIRLQQQFVT